jgi:hypothetical protein
MQECRREFMIIYSKKSFEPIVGSRQAILEPHCKKNIVMDFLKTLLSNGSINT